MLNCLVWFLTCINGEVMSFSMAALLLLYPEVGPEERLRFEPLHKVLLLMRVRNRRSSYIRHRERGKEITKLFQNSKGWFFLILTSFKMIKCHWPSLPVRELAAVVFSSPVRSSHGVGLVHVQSLLLPLRVLDCSHAIEAQCQMDIDPPFLVNQELCGRASGSVCRILEYYKEM